MGWAQHLQEVVLERLVVSLEGNREEQLGQDNPFEVWFDQLLEEWIYAQFQIHVYSIIDARYVGVNIQ